MKAKVDATLGVCFGFVPHQPIDYKRLANTTGVHLSNDTSRVLLERGRERER